MTKFTFADREEGFDAHIDMSIRGYSDLCADVLKYSQYFVEDDTNVVDIGCSTGKMLTRMSEEHKSFCKPKYIGVEIESSFFTQQEKINDIEYVHGDIRAYDFDNCSLVTSIFTLQFMPQKDRLRLIENIYDGLNVGGGFIFAEKMISEYSKINDMRTFTFYDFKKNNFTYDDIMNKEKTLRHMMKLNTRNELLEMCERVGFTQIDTFWQNHAFAGFIAIKN